MLGLSVSVQGLKFRVEALDFLQPGWRFRTRLVRGLWLGIA